MRLHLSVMLFGLLAGGATPMCAAPLPVPILFHGAENSPAIAQIEFGRPGAYDPRGPLGRDEATPEFHRAKTLGSLTNVVFKTQPLVAPAEPLRLNVDTLLGQAALQRGAYVFVEVLGGSGAVIPGFERDKCMIADVNRLDHLLQWREPGTEVVRDTRTLAGLTISLRFLLRDARIYSLHTRTAPAREPASLTLKVTRPSLPAWDTGEFVLEARTAEGQAVPLDHLPVVLEVSDPALLTARLDKRDRSRGTLTVVHEIPAPTEITVRAVVAASGRELRSERVSVRATPAVPTVGREDFRLYFLTPDDLQDSKGQVALTANTLHYYADTRGLPATPRAMTVFSQRMDDRYAVWGSSRLDSEGQIFRAETADGLTYTSTPVETTMNPEHLLDMFYNPEAQQYVAIERAGPNFNNPMRWALHTSRDGRTFTRSGETYHDFDGVEMIWDPVHHQCVSFQLTFQPLPEPRQFPDNLGNVVTRHDNRARRIFARRTSPDLRQWTPSNDMDQRNPSTWTRPEHYSIVPDQSDPPDFECYWLDVFPYGDRYLGLIMYMAVAPTTFLRAFPYDAPPSLHGPHVTTEWIVTSDLLHWQRPFRGIPATDDVRIYFMHEPMELHDRLLFQVPNQIYANHVTNPIPAGAVRRGPAAVVGANFGQNIEVYSVPQDRIAGVKCSGSSSFTTKAFVCPPGPLHLNAQGTVAIEVLAEDGRLLPGFEGTRCQLSDVDALHAKLQWGDHDSRALAGRKIRLSFRAASAVVYSVHTLASNASPMK